MSRRPCHPLSPAPAHCGGPSLRARIVAVFIRRIAPATVLAVVLLAGAVVAARFAVANPASRSVYNLDIDTAAYDALALELSQTRDVRAVPTSQPPGFVMLLALIYTVFGHSYTAAKLTFCAMVLATAGLAGRLAWSRIGPLEGVIATTLTVFSPILVAYAATLQYEVPAAFLSMLITALVLVERPRRGAAAEYAWTAAIAVTCATAALVREVLVVLFPIAMAAMISRQWTLGRTRQAMVAAAVMVAVFSAPIATWAWIQYEHTGRLVFISEKADLNLRIGNNPTANGTYHLQLQPIVEPSGWGFIRERPPHVARLAVRKIMYFWGLARDPWTVPHHSAVFLSRTVGNVVPFEWSLTAARGGFLAVLFAAGVFLLSRRPRLWVLPAMVLAVMAVHILYFSSQRFAVPVQAQIYVCAAAAVGAILRRLMASGRSGLVSAAVAAVWIVAAQTLWLPGSYAAEAESLEGLSARNVADPLAINGMARFGAQSGGARPIVFFTAESFPRGGFVVRVRARTEECANPSEPALVVSVRNQERVSRFTDMFTVGDLCRSAGYNVLLSPAVLREDEIIDLSINTAGTVGVWVDRVEILFGYRRRREVPLTH